ncbi:MAG: hypothetical protein LC652_08325 [Halomonas sp.]|nr:hypothetical protein [Halomonas sp.]
MTESKQSEPTAWHALSGDESLEHLDSTLDGLDDQEAQRRLNEHGPNQLQQAESRPWWKRLLEQFNNILMLVLIVAAIASLGLGHILDASAIFGVVLIIALIGFFQEGKAEQALESIRQPALSHRGGLADRGVHAGG